jgi:MPBQ/MSBQ methyltransferase
MRFIQHKKEAFWFYRFLSIFYDKLVNPLFWTPKMRDESLEIGKLDDPALKTIDVGSGTGFTTVGIVKHIAPANLTCVDQSPHQMAHAKARPELADCSFQLGDAENLPVATSSFDRYVSAGSIEYWPNPQLGVNESYRVIKPGGTALLIGPLQPENWFARLMANVWMLFPADAEYREYYEKAGFENVRVRYVRPHWFRRESEYGIAIAGEKPLQGPAEVEMPATPTEVPAEEKGFFRSLLLILRLLIGSIGGFIFIPIALIGYLFNAFRSQKDVPPEYRETLNVYQVVVLVIIFGLIGWGIGALIT